MSNKKKNATFFSLPSFINALVIFIIFFLVIYTIFYIHPSLVRRSTEFDNANSIKVIRKPAAAGTYYPVNSYYLKKQLDEFYSNTNGAPDENLLALIVPHAGYRYSGQLAMDAYSYVPNESMIVIILAPSHQSYFSGLSVSGYTHYQTPLGLVEVSDFAEQIRENMSDDVTIVAKAHEDEHSIEVQLPFLQYMLENFSIVPILVGSGSSYEDLREIGYKLNSQINTYLQDNPGKRFMVVVSSDFTHYGESYGYVPFENDTYFNLKNLCEDAYGYISSIDTNGFYDHLYQTQDTICGRCPIIILLSMLEQRITYDETVDVDKIGFTTSGNMTGSFNNLVSYLAVKFSSEDNFFRSSSSVSPNDLTSDDKKYLLEAARASIKIYLESGEKLNVDEKLLPPELVVKKGCFVTLNEEENLRGCIGTLSPQKKLYQCVIDNAVNAAVNDERFEKLSLDEFDDVEVELSVLTVPDVLEYTSSENLLDSLRPEVDGVILKKGFLQATYLPQVWGQIPEKEMFLSSLCVKAGMDDDCWQNKPTVYTYEAEVFSE